MEERKLYETGGQVYLYLVCQLLAYYLSNAPTDDPCARIVHRDPGSNRRGVSIVRLSAMEKVYTQGRTAHLDVAFHLHVTSSVSVGAFLSVPGPPVQASC